MTITRLPFSSALDRRLRELYDCKVAEILYDEPVECLAVEEYECSYCGEHNSGHDPFCYQCEEFNDSVPLKQKKKMFPFDSAPSRVGWSVEDMPNMGARRYTYKATNSEGVIRGGGFVVTDEELVSAPPNLILNRMLETELAIPNPDARKYVHVTHSLGYKVKLDAS